MYPIDYAMFVALSRQKNHRPCSSNGTRLNSQRSASRILDTRALRQFQIALAIQSILIFVLLLLLLIIKFAALPCRCECRALPFVPANGQQLRSDGVLWHEAVVVERLEQRDVRNPL